MPDEMLCEICDEPVDARYGCAQCARMYGDCCTNLENGDYCCECEPDEDEDEDPE